MVWVLSYQFMSPVPAVLSGEVLSAPYPMLVILLPFVVGLTRTLVPSDIFITTTLFNAASSL